MRFGLAVSMIGATIGLAATPASATTAVVRMPVDPAGLAFADCVARPAAPVCGAAGAADILFVDPADPRRPVSTGSFSLLAAEGGAVMTAYDAAGRAIGSARGMGDGERMTLAGPIARIAVRPVTPPGTGARAAAMSHVPEPASWTMLLVGFAMMAMGVRYCIRRSEARFDERIPRIAAGEAA